MEFAASWTMLKQYARCGRKCEGPSAACSVSLDGMPPEILLKILSYLDAVTLLCAGCVNRRFYHLANDNLSLLMAVTSAPQSALEDFLGHLSCESMHHRTNRPIAGMSFKDHG